MFANKLHLFLEPIIGHAPARRLILNYSARVNRPPQQLTQDDLPEIGRYLAENIHVFVGSAQSKQIVGLFSGIANQSSSN